MVGFHVVDDEVVDLAVADDLVDVLDELGEEVNLHCVNETYLLVVDEVRVVAHAIGQRPESFKQVLVAVVDANIIDFVCNFQHSFFSYCFYFVCKDTTI